MLSNLNKGYYFKILLLVMLLFGAIVAIIFWSENRAQEDFTTIVVTQAEFAEGDQVSTIDRNTRLMLQDVHNDNLPNTYFTNLDDVVGQYTRSMIPSDTILQHAHFSSTPLDETNQNQKERTKVPLIINSEFVSGGSLQAEDNLIIYGVFEAEGEKWSGVVSSNARVSMVRGNLEDGAPVDIEIDQADFSKLINIYTQGNLYFLVNTSLDEVQSILVDDLFGGLIDEAGTPTTLEKPVFSGDAKQLKEDRLTFFNEPLTLEWRNFSPDKVVVTHINLEGNIGRYNGNYTLTTSNPNRKIYYQSATNTYSLPFEDFRTSSANFVEEGYYEIAFTYLEENTDEETGETTHTRKDYTYHFVIENVNGDPLEGWQVRSEGDNGVADNTWVFKYDNTLTSIEEQHKNTVFYKEYFDFIEEIDFQKLIKPNETDGEYLGYEFEIDKINIIYSGQQGNVYIAPSSTMFGKNPIDISPSATLAGDFVNKTKLEAYEDDFYGTGYESALIQSIRENYLRKDIETIHNTTGFASGQLGTATEQNQVLLMLYLYGVELDQLDKEELAYWFNDGTVRLSIEYINKDGETTVNPLTVNINVIWEAMEDQGGDE